MPAPNAPSRVEDHLTDAQTAADTLVGTFVGSICQSGQSTLRLGEDLLADWLGYDIRDEESRQQMRRTTAIGAGGLFGLGFLLGTRTGRSVLRDVVVLGGAAILGKAAVDAGAALVDRISDPAPRKVSLLASVIARATDGREVTQDEIAAHRRPAGSASRSPASGASGKIHRPHPRRRRTDRADRRPGAAPRGLCDFGAALRIGQRRGQAEPWPSGPRLRL